MTHFPFYFLVLFVSGILSQESNIRGIDPLNDDLKRSASSSESDQDTSENKSSLDLDEGGPEVARQGTQSGVLVRTVRRSWPGRRRSQPGWRRSLFRVRSRQ